MRCCELIGIKKGITAIIGGGGKTTLMYTLASELSAGGKVIVTTTTHIGKPGHLTVASDELDITKALENDGIVCAARDCKNGKLCAPDMPVENMLKLAEYVLIEADGSKGLPFKAHAEYEPVVPPCCSRTILVAGASGFYKPIKEAAHRAELYANIAGCGINDAITPETASRVIIKEGLQDSVFINQIETRNEIKYAQELAGLLKCGVYGGALMKGEWQCLR